MTKKLRTHAADTEAARIPREPGSRRHCLTQAGDGGVEAMPDADGEEGPEEGNTEHRRPSAQDFLRVRSVDVSQRSSAEKRRPRNLRVVWIKSDRPE